MIHSMNDTDTSIVKDNAQIDVSLNKRLSTEQRRFLQMLCSGLEQRLCLENLHIDSATYFHWKQNPIFLAWERDIERDVTLVGPKLAKEIMLTNAANVAEVMTSRALDKNARDSQRAGETILEVAGVISKQANVTIPVTVQNVSLMLAQYQQVNVTPKDDTKST